MNLRTDFTLSLNMSEYARLPSEIIEAPLTMQNIATNETVYLQCKTGILGVYQDSDGVIHPEIGYYVTK